MSSLSKKDFYEIMNYNLLIHKTLNNVRGERLPCNITQEDTYWEYYIKDLEVDDILYIPSHKGKKIKALWGISSFEKIGDMRIIKFNRLEPTSTSTFRTNEFITFPMDSRTYFRILR